MEKKHIPIRFCVIGSRHGMYHVNNLLKITDAVLCSICVLDMTEEKRQFMKTTGIKIFTNFDKMNSEVKFDAAIICTPNNEHHTFVEKCAKKGIDVLIEKPIADTVINANKIVEIVKKNKINALVGYHRRFSSNVNLLKRLITKGVIGRPIGATIIWADYKPDKYFYHDGQRKWQTRVAMGG